MRSYLEVVLTGLAAVRLYPFRSAACVLTLVAVLLPYLTGHAVARGLEAEAEASARRGADLYLTGTRFGRPAPVPVGVVEDVRRTAGVTAVAPRIVGTVTLGRDRVPAVLVGMPPEYLREWAGEGVLEGSLPRATGPHEFVIGTGLARRLGLKIGAVIPPFYRNDRRGERLSRVVGIFRSDAPPWQENLILTTYGSAEAVFDEEGFATDLLIWCEPEESRDVARRLTGLRVPAAAGSGGLKIRVTPREEVLALLPRGPRHLGGVLTLLYLPALSCCVLVLVVTSGVGLPDRRREVGILKATRWQTDEVLLRGASESCALALAAACIALLGAWVWLRLLGGYGVATIFLAGGAVTEGTRVPYQLTPASAVLAFVLATAVILTGTLVASWRAAAAPPREAMR